MHRSRDYLAAKTEGRNFYACFAKIFSPAIGEEVHFTSEGFNHLIFKRARWERKISAQISRFRVLPHAIKAITLATTYQEFEKTENKITYWGIIAIIDNEKIKVVLRKTGNHGQVHFWSVFPHWVTSKHRDAKLFKNN